MSVFMEANDIRQMDIKFREQDDGINGYAVVYLNEHVAPISVCHFSFLMTIEQFKQQVAALEASSEKSGFKLNLQRKSRLTLALEKIMVGALAGLEYRNHGCPACRMIDTFIAGALSAE